MTDTVIKKTILDHIHALVAEVVHILLILPVAGLKSVIAGLMYVHDELAKY